MIGNNEDGERWRNKGLLVDDDGGDNADEHEDDSDGDDDVEKTSLLP